MPAIVRAGALRHRITLQAKTTGSPTRTAMGAPDDGWVTQDTVWAAVRPLRSRELMAAQAAASEVDTEIEIRYRSDITAAWRVVHGSTVYNIEGIRNPEMRNVKLLLDCSTGVNAG